MKVGIPLKSIRLRRVTCLCAVSEEVFSSARLSQLRLVVTFYPHAGAVVFERIGHEPHVVLAHMVDTMVPEDPADLDRWLTPDSWSSAPPFGDALSSAPPFSQVGDWPPGPEPEPEREQSPALNPPGPKPRAAPEPKAAKKKATKKKKRGRPAGRVR